MHDRHPAHLARAWLLATLVGVATLAAAASARAGTASFWVCHGPAGQPLGSGPLAPSAAADGVTGAYGGGCAAPADGVGDGGLSATFTRPDPVAGSSAAWILGIPANVSLTSVGIPGRRSASARRRCPETRWSIPRGRRPARSSRRASAMRATSRWPAARASIRLPVRASASASAARSASSCAAPRHRRGLRGSMSQPSSSPSATSRPRRARSAGSRARCPAWRT